MPFDQVPQAFSPQEKKDWLYFLACQCYGIGMSIWTFNSLFSQCGPLHPLYLGPINPCSPDWWKKEVL